MTKRSVSMGFHLFPYKARKVRHSLVLLHVQPLPERFGLIFSLSLRFESFGQLQIRQERPDQHLRHDV